MDRDAALTQLSTVILHLPQPPGGILRVGIDGPDASGKTTLAKELAEALRRSGKVVISASLDRFHHPRKVRYRQGQLSPTGYYEDAFNLPALRSNLLDPLAPGSSHQIRLGVFDLHRDEEDLAELQTVSEGAILLFEGVFALRPELRDAWDYSIFVQVTLDTILQRAEVRDAAAMGSREAVRTRYLNRYLPAQQYYLSRFRPDLHADVIWVNDDPAEPQLLFKK